MADKPTPPLSSVPIPKRGAPPKYLQTTVFALFFNTSIILANLSQFLFLTLYPFPITRPLYEKAITYTKLLFGRLLVAISQLFGPTKLVVSYSDENGKALDPEVLVQRNADGSVEKIDLPSKSVWISNHQVRRLSRGTR